MYVVTPPPPPEEMSGRKGVRGVRGRMEGKQKKGNTGKGERQGKLRGRRGKASREGKWNLEKF